MKQADRGAFLYLYPDLRIWGLLTGLLFFAACGSLTSGFPYESDLDGIASRMDQRVAVEEIFPYFDYDSVPVRRQAAWALANLRNPDAVEFICSHLSDERDTGVSEMLLFALGQIGDARAGSTVLKFFASDVETVRAAALEAAGKLKDPSLTSPVMARLIGDASPLVRAEACLALFRLGARRYDVKPALDEKTASARTSALVEALLHDASASVRWRAAYALAEIGAPAAAAPLREALLHDEDVWVRTFSARGLAAMPPEMESYNALVAGVEAAHRSGEWNVAVEGIVALGRYARDKNVSLEIAARLINYLLPGRNSSFHVRAVAARTLGRFKAAKVTIRKALVRATNDPSHTVVGEAIVALGALGDAVDILEQTALSKDRFIRMKTVEAAHLMGTEGIDLLLELARDVSIRVRCTALEALQDPMYGPYAADIEPLAEEAVALNDLSLRYTGARLLTVLEARKSLPVLESAYFRSFEPEMAEARLKIVEAVAALGGPGDEVFFREAVKDPDFDVRTTASKALATLSGELVQVPPRVIRRQVIPKVGVDYMNGRPDPVAHFITNKGEFWVELFQDDAPTHVKNFIRLAREKVYDKLTFHRMVSNFVVQGLDPRGDGWGFCNVRLRDEINRRKFLSGYVGMPNSGPDTGGCQIFITHCPTPHLDGAYTNFGRVIAGMDTVDRLEVGDVVLEVTVE